MKPILVKLPLWLPFLGSFDLPIYAYGSLLVIGMVAGILLARRLVESQGIPMQPVEVLDLTVVATVSGVLGSRIFYLIQYPTSFADAFKVWQGGLVFQGGLAGGTIGVVWFLRRRRLPVLRIGDILMPCLFLGLAWGRLGCFMNGCCFGPRADALPWAVQFPRGSPAHGRHVELYPEEVGADDACSLPVHPTQIYSSMAAALLGLALLGLLQRKRFEGQVVAASAMAYAVLRFLLEFFRADVGRGSLELTNAQILSLVLFAIGAAIYPLWSRGGSASLTVQK
ncbi:MAG: prolipoprotein diacylglyceryl transferase [Planctomycetes bacterium]|nr:prolipoprotein diacylglyceryl transferase [Planctomycetota bacterium]